MYAIIDRQAMRLVCRVKLKTEAEKVTNPLHVVIATEEPDAFKVLTTLELKLLYRNLGSVMGTNLQQRESVVSSIRTLLKHVPFSSLDQRPLFTDEAPAKPAKSSAAQAGTGRDRVPVNTVAPARTAGVRGVIWDHADKVWEAAGKPTNKGVVMALRKQMMTELEGMGVKRTSSSNELGNWMKARVPV